MEHTRRAEWMISWEVPRFLDFLKKPGSDSSCYLVAGLSCGIAKDHPSRNSCGNTRLFLRNFGLSFQSPRDLVGVERTCTSFVWNKSARFFPQIQIQRKLWTPCHEEAKRQYSTFLLSHILEAYCGASEETVRMFYSPFSSLDEVVWRNELGQWIGIQGIGQQGYQSGARSTSILSNHKNEIFFGAWIGICDGTSEYLWESWGSSFSGRFCTWRMPHRPAINRPMI